MPRELQPCGTPAAYRRHLRKKETPCEACRVAHAIAKVEREDAARAVAALAAVPEITEADESDVEPPSDEEYDPLSDAKENLRIVKKALDDAHPRQVAALSKRRQELVALIAELGGKKERSVADELADLRARRAGA